MTQEIETKTGNPVDVSEKPPAAQLTTNYAMKHTKNIMPVCPQVGGHSCKGRPKNTLFVLLLAFAKEKGRFFETGEANS